MNGTVLDILIYVFDRYMFDEAPRAQREAWPAPRSAGFGPAMSNVRWTGWPTCRRARPRPDVCRPGQHEGAPRRSVSLRFTRPWNSRVSPRTAAAAAVAGQAEILRPTQRELVIDRLLALESEDLNLEQVRWIVLMVLSSQPGQEQACARMETLVFDTDTSTAH